MFTLILIGIVTFLFYVYFKIKYSYWENRGVKGPKPIPFLGTTLSENLSPPKETELKFLKEYGRVFGSYFGTRPVFNTSVKEHIKTVLTDLKTFPNVSTMRFNDQYLQNSMFFRNGEDWRTVRAVQSQYFTSKKLKDLFGHFEKVSSNFMDNLSTLTKTTKSNDIQVKKICKCYSVDVIAKVLFAIDVDSFKEQDTIFVKNAMRIGDLNPIQTILMTVLPDFVSSALSLSFLNLEPTNELGKYFKVLFRKRREDGIKYFDLTETLQDAIDNKKCELTEDELIGNILGLFFAGSESVANALCHFFYFMSEHPDIQVKLYDEVVREFSKGIDYETLTQNEYLEAVVNEILRLGGHVTIQNRTVAKKTKLGEFELEPGTELRLITYVENILPENYIDPMTFNPDRFLKSSNEGKDAFFIPFGYGNKKCLGLMLSMTEIKYLLVRIIQKYTILKANNTHMKMISFRGFSFVESFHVSLQERN